MRSKQQVVLGWVAALALGAGALQAETVYGGLDSWITKGDGTSFVDFSRQPIPAGFFCAGSKAFTGKVVWLGAAISTDDPRVAVDTLVQRLDDVTFDERGRGVSRLQMKALNLESVAPIQTDCGAYNVRANLAGRQPITRMQIFLEGNDGGRYLAPLALNAKLTFTPADRGGRSLELRRSLRLGADARAQWAFNREKARPQGTIQVDTDGDGIPDTALPRSSNFSAGRPASQDKYTYCEGGRWFYCHPSDGYEHCVESCERSSCDLEPQFISTCL
jgi:hypothetical protein